MALAVRVWYTVIHRHCTPNTMCEFNAFSRFRCAFACVYMQSTPSVLVLSISLNPIANKAHSFVSKKIPTYLSTCFCYAYGRRLRFYILNEKSSSFVSAKCLHKQIEQKTTTILNAKMQLSLNSPAIRPNCNRNGNDSNRMRVERNSYEVLQ